MCSLRACVTVASIGGAAAFANLSLLLRDLRNLELDVLSQPIEQRHVEVRDPHEGESRNHVASPSLEEQREAGDHEEKRGHVVAEAVFAGEEVEKLSRGQSSAR